jgi:flagellar hook-length control protein FliK
MGRSEGAAGFEQWLERGLGRANATGGSSIAERMEQRVEAQVMGRVRALGGRSSGVDAREGRNTSSAADTRPERGLAEAQRAERAARKGPAERAHERPRERDERGADDARGAASPDAPRVEQRAHAAEASGAEAPSPEGTSLDGASSAPALQAPANGGRAAAVAAAGVQSALPMNGAAVVGPAATNTSANALHGGAVDGPRAAAGVKVTEAAEALPRSAPAQDLELAEKVMRQLRARLQIGQREALIELRPSELGRIGVHLRFEDGALTATIRAERPETLAVLEAHAPELRAWLAQDGAEVREIDLGLAEHGAYFDKPQQQAHDRAQGRRGSSSERETRLLAPEAIQPVHTSTGGATQSTDMPSVDLLV